MQLPRANDPRFCGDMMYCDRHQVGGLFTIRVENEPTGEDVVAGMNYLMQLYVRHNQHKYCIVVKLCQLVYWKGATDEIR